MGFWSSIKKAVKKIVKAIKAVVRAVVRIVVIVLTAVFKVWDLVFGWLGWPPKKLKLHIAVLRGPNGDLLKDLNELWPSIELLKTTFKDRCNVDVLPYSSGNERAIDNWAQVVNDIAPTSALKVRCDLGALWDEGGEAGDFFARHTAGWVGGFFPISLAFPVTVFIVEEVSEASGCAVPVLTDYATVAASALTNKGGSTLAHEVGHRCNLWHVQQKENLLNTNRVPLPPYWLTWWQRNFIRASRHVTYLF
ncbi:MAG: hypothetical protein ABIO38_03865 [Luteimonas sp.]